MTRLLLLHRGGDQIRGSEEALLTLLSGLDRQRFQPLVICSDAVLSAQVQRLGCEAQLGDFPEIMIAGRRSRAPLLRYARAFTRLRRMCRAQDVGVILCNGGAPCQLAVPAARGTGTPVLCILHHPAGRRYHALWLTRHVTAWFAPATTRRASTEACTDAPRG
jgi:hypothetical protein